MHIKLNDRQSVDMKEMLLFKKDNSDCVIGNKQGKMCFYPISLNIYEEALTRGD